MLSELVFEQIEGNFWYAAYGPFRVVMMKDTGYINATKLCSSGGKVYGDWIKNKSSRELIQALETQLALENTQDSVQTSNCRIPQLQGSLENSNLPLENTDWRILQSVISPLENTEGRILLAVISASQKATT